MPIHVSQRQAESLTIDKLFQQAWEHHQAGRLFEAGQLYQTILQAQPAHAEANHNLGLIAVQADQAEAGLPYLATALDADPACARFWVGYIDALFRAGHRQEARAMFDQARQQGLEGEAVEALAARFAVDERQGEGPISAGGHLAQEEMDDAVRLFGEGRYDEVVVRARRIAERFPEHEFGWKLLGVVLKLLGRSVEAVEPMRRAAALSPGDVESQYNLGVTLQELARLEEAEACYRRALELDPTYSDALLNLGVTLMRLHRLDEAEETLRAVQRVAPACVAAYNNLGTVLLEGGRLEEAESCLRQALQLDPGNAGVHENLGNVFYRQGRLQDAEKQFREALRIDPNKASVHASLGVVLQEQGSLDEADGHFQIALQLDPEDARAYDRRGSIHYVKGRLREAEACFRRALQIVPEEAGIHANLGRLLWEQGCFGEAESCLRRALEIRPDDMRTRNYLGLTLQEQGSLDAAEACFRRVLAMTPDDSGVVSNLGQALLSLGRIDEAGAHFRRARQLAPHLAPLHSNLLYHLTLTASTDPQAVFAEHLAFGERFEAELKQHWPVHANSRDPERVLRVGFVSPDFYNHAVASFIEPVLVHLSGHPELSLHAFYSHCIDDEVTQRLRRQFAHWHQVASLSDAELAEKIQAEGIDILIDLTGHTARNRLLAFARKPAPVQASWVGYPGTTGLRAVDYYLADRFVLPPDLFDDQFTEKIVCLPANAPFLPSSAAPPVNELPALRNGYVTFGSFNRPNKLSRDVIALWSQLLRALPNSRMLLGAMPAEGQYDIWIEWFEEEGISRDRLDFQPRSGMEHYLALHHRVDICLDTFPYNGGTTTHHALWMGVPTLTLAGPAASGRVGAAILSQIGLQDFVVENKKDFVARGLCWANKLAELNTLRVGLRERLRDSPSRDPGTVAVGLAFALRIMWRRWCQGMPAKSFEVPLDGAVAAIREAGQ